MATKSKLRYSVGHKRWRVSLSTLTPVCVTVKKIVKDNTEGDVEPYYKFNYIVADGEFGKSRVGPPWFDGDTAMCDRGCRFATEQEAWQHCRLLINAERAVVKTRLEALYEAERRAIQGLKTSK